MATDVEARETSSSTDVERVAHAYCARCNPEPRPGDEITALCGVTYPFWGRRDRPTRTCPICATLAAEVVYRCGHSAQSM